ncbi:MAG: tetratricopeptide repeat protein [Bacteroidales bacterium]|nr:tetratricopeptide repeat protein [Bacteroidales bacterium]
MEVSCKVALSGDARSLYYLGLSYYYAQDYKEAILEFTKAEKVAERSDSLYLGFIKVAQADTYAKCHNYEESINCLIQFRGSHER